MNSVILALESPFPAHGALRVRICEFLRGLDGEICLIVFGDEPGVSPLPAPYRGVLHTVPWPERKPVGHARRLFRPPALIANFTSEAYAGALREAVAQSPDLVFAVGLHVARYLELVPRRIPRLLDDHDVVWLVQWRKAQTLPSRTGIGRLLLQWEAFKLRQWERRLLQATSLAIAISETDAAHLRRLAGATPVRVVGPTIPEYDANAGAPDQKQVSEPRLVFTGVFSYEPNITGAEWFCRRALPILRSRIGPVQVQLVGRHAEEHVAHLADIPGVVVTGEVPSIVPYIRSATISIVPLQFGSGVRYKILEAFALGTPVVSTSLGCEGLGLQADCQLLIGDTPEDFAAACERVIRDRSLHQRLVEQGAEFVQHTNDRSRRAFRDAVAQVCGSQSVKP